MSDRRGGKKWVKSVVSVDGRRMRSAGKIIKKISIYIKIVYWKTQMFSGKHTIPKCLNTLF